jgi:hypothetical protein
VNVLELLARSSDADARAARALYEASGDVDYLVMAEKWERQAADFRATLISRVFA